MIFLLALALLAVAYVAVVVCCLVGLARGGWRRAAGFAGMALLLLPPAGLAYAVGVFAGGLDEAESCALSGHEYDGEYASAHRRDFFPVSHPCHAGHDLVAGWVNPTLVILVLASVACAGIALFIAVTRRPGAGH